VEYTDPERGQSMAVDPKLLEILVCPEDKGPLQLVPLDGAACSALVARYREQFKDEEPVVEEGLRCNQCGRVYPIVSDIPVMLVEEALTGDAAHRPENDGG
jgi:uncharacterized protein YbaR (Trm112 family)